VIAFQKYEKRLTALQLGRSLLVAVCQGLCYRWVKLRDNPFESRLDVGEFLCCLHLDVLDLQRLPREGRIGH
jgi:hypothetical protein